MTTYHMDTDSVRAMASHMRQISERVREQLSQLQQSAYAADWQGPNRDEFVMEASRMAQAIAAQVEAGMVLSQRVDAEVTEWEGLAAKYASEMSDVISTFAATTAAMGIAATAAVTSPTSIANVHVTKVPPYTYARFSQLAYSNNPKLEKDLEDQGWEILTTAQKTKINQKGYDAVAIYNKNTGELVIAHRGTDDWFSRDVTSNGKLASGFMPGQFDVSRKFVEHAKQVAAEKHGENFTITHTGHSLGAVLSDLNAMADKTKGIAFDSPGSLQVIERNRGKFPSPHYGRENLISYQSNPNLVHLGGKDAGYVVKFTPEDLGNFKIVLDDKSVVNLSTPGGMVWEINRQIVKGFYRQTEIRHSMDNIVNSISAETGFPNNYTDSIPPVGLPKAGGGGGGGGAW